MDRMEPRVMLEAPAREIPEPQLNDYYADAYGIFSGKSDKAALLCFTPEAARWVADEHWHPSHWHWQSERGPRRRDKRPRGQ